MYNFHQYVGRHSPKKEINMAAKYKFMKTR